MLPMGSGRNTDLNGAARIDEPPAHGPMDHRDRTDLDHDERAPLLVVDLLRIHHFDIGGRLSIASGLVELPSTVEGICPFQRWAVS